MHNKDSQVVRVSGGAVRRLHLIFAVIATLAVTAACDHIVEPGAAEPEAMALNPSNAVIEEGDFFELKAVDGARGSRTLAATVGVVWKSSNPSVATVTDGMVEARAIGEATITATTEGGASATSTVRVERTPDQVQLLGGMNLTQGQVGEPVGEELVVRVVSRTGKPVSGVEVKFHTSAGAGVTSPVIATSDADGVARTNWTLGPIAGDQRVEVLVAPRTGALGVFKTEAQPGPAHDVSIVPEQASFNRGASYQLSAVLRDAFGNQIGSVPVQWFSANDQVVQVDQNGRATGLAAGTSLIEAIPVEDAAGVSGAVAEDIAAAPGKRRGQTTIIVIEGDGGSIGVVGITGGDGQTGRVGETLGSHLSVQVLDATGSPVRQTDVQWVVTAGGGSVSSAVTRTNGQGHADVRWTLGTVAGSNKVEARVAGVGSATFSATAIVGPIARVDVAPASVQLEVGAEAAFSATARDDFGNVVGSHSGVSWSVENAAIASISPAGVVKALAGGSTRVRASIEGVSGYANVTVSGSNGGGSTPAVASVVVTPSEVTIEGLEQPLKLTAATFDAQGGEISGATLEWAAVDPSIATVDNQGNVVSRAVGTVLIIVTATCCNAADTAIVSVTSDALVERPQQVTDLRVLGTTPNSATLRFTEVSDGTGSPADYQLRYALHPIGWEWGQATPVTEGTCADPLKGSSIGSELTCVVEGLDAGVKYDFQLVAFRSEEDGSRTFSWLSNAATGDTGSNSTGVARVEASESSVAFTALEQEFSVEAVGYDDGGNVVTGTTMSWQTTNAGVAAVTQTGRITAKSVGTALVIVSAACCQGGEADTIEVAVTQKMAAVSVDPGSASITEGSTRQFTATARDANGYPMPLSGFAWSSSDTQVASVSSDGMVTAHADGQSAILASKDGVTGQGEALVGQDIGGGEAVTYTNEPAGFETVVHYSMQEMFPWPGAEMAGGVGRWWQWEANDPNTSLHVETGVPGGPSFNRTRYPAGQTPGVAPVMWGGWDVDRREFSALYVSKMIRLADNGRGEWESHGSGTKMGYWAVSGESGAANEMYLIIEGGTHSAFAGQVRQQYPVTRNMSPNRVSHATIQVGEWQHWELEFRVNDIGVANGEVRWWVDGTLILEYTDVVFRTAEHPRGFYAYKWDPTWGGQGGPDKQFTDYVDISSIRMSGIVKH